MQCQQTELTVWSFGSAHSILLALNYILSYCVVTSWNLKPIENRCRTYDLSAKWQLRKSRKIGGVSYFLIFLVIIYSVKRVIMLLLVTQYLLRESLLNQLVIGVFLYLARSLFLIQRKEDHKNITFHKQRKNLQILTLYYNTIINVRLTRALVIVKQISCGSSENISWMTCHRYFKLYDKLKHHLQSKTDMHFDITLYD